MASAERQVREGRQCLDTHPRVDHQAYGALVQRYISSIKGIPPAKMENQRFLQLQALLKEQVQCHMGGR